MAAGVILASDLLLEYLQKERSEALFRVLYSKVLTRFGDLKAELERRSFPTLSRISG